MSSNVRMGPAPASAAVMVGVLATLVGCGAPAPDEEAATRSESIVYGADDRVDVFAHPDAELRGLARSSIVALVPEPTLSVGVSGEVEIDAQSFGDAYQLCPGEPFADQPSAAACSGVLVSSDLVVTAAHCLRTLGDELSCEQHAYAFDYLYAEENRREPLEAEDVYFCRRIVATVEVELTDGSTRRELAVVQLDREVDEARTPVSVRRAALAAGEPLAVLGFPSGLPLKIDTGSRVIEPAVEGPDYFSLDSDTFSSSSGSGVFDDEGALVGVFLRGCQDFDMTSGDCQTVHVVEDTNEVAMHEEAMYAARMLEPLCASDWAASAADVGDPQGVSALCPDDGNRDSGSDRSSESGCSVGRVPVDQGERIGFLMAGALLLGLGARLARRRR